LAIPIKDFKDIEGDKKYGVWTIPVIFGDKNGRLVVSVGIFIAYMLSVFLLHELRLFWWAFMFSIITFSFLNFAKTEPRRLPWVILGIVGIYGMILVGIVFL
jgi:4-hydroxybenzoate polyprenyltransferase